MATLVPKEHWDTTGMWMILLETCVLVVIRTYSVLSTHCSKILMFTLEKPDDKGCIVFLDRKTQRDVEGSLSSQWDRNETDTGVLLNFYASSLDIYKRSIVAGMLQRIYMTTSNWKNFKNAILEAHNIFRNNKTQKISLSVSPIQNWTKSSMVPNKMAKVATLYPTEKSSSPWWQTKTHECWSYYHRHYTWYRGAPLIGSILFKTDEACYQHQRRI